MKKAKQTEKRLSLKKLQIVKLNMIRGGDDGATKTNADTTTSQNCPKKPNTLTGLPPDILVGGGDGGNGGTKYL